jgi:cyclic pyranopterin phosphate synthase
MITRGGNLDDVLKGIGVAREVGLNPVKLNTVVVSGINDDEIIDFASRTINEEWHVRFIELMPSSSVEMEASQFVSVNDMKQHLESLGELELCMLSASNGPAKYFRFPGAKGTIGFITPISEHFCFLCNRLRLTSDGKLHPCLLSREGIDLREPLRNGASSAELKRLIEEAAATKPGGHNLADGGISWGSPFSQVGG